MFWLLIFIIAALALAYRRASIRSSAIVFGGVLLAYGVLGHSLVLFIFLALIWIAIVVPLSVTALRQEWLSRPALNAFRRGVNELPPETLRLLQTGESSCDAELFGGAPDWAMLRAVSFPEQPEVPQQGTQDDPIALACAVLANAPSDLSAGDCLLEAAGKAEGTAAMRNTISAYAGALIGGDAWAFLGPMRMAWLQMLHEEANAGRPRDWLEQATRCRDTFAAASVAVDPIGRTGGWARVARNSKNQGNEGKEPHLRLTIAVGVRAPYRAEYYGLLVRLGSGGKSPQGATCIILPAATEGLEVIADDKGRVLLRGNGLALPMSALLGGARQIGHGASRLGEALAKAQAQYAPPLRIGALLPLALSNAAIARIHVPFELPLCQRHSVRSQLASHAADLYAVDALRQLTLSVLGAGHTPGTLAFITESQIDATAQRFLSTLYGRGGALASLATQAQSPKLSPLVPAELGLRILGRCHPHLRRELAAAAGPQAADTMAEFDEALWAHIGHVQSNAVRSLLAACGAGKLLTPAGGLPPSSARCLRRIDRASANLALLTDLALFGLRGRAFLNDTLLAALGDALGALQRASATLWLAQHGSDSARPALMRIATTEALDTVHNHFEDLIRELPRAWQRGLARLLVMPFGHWRMSRRRDDIERAVQWFTEGPAGLYFSRLLPPVLPEAALRLRRTLEATLAGEPLAARLQEVVFSAEEPLDRISQAESSGHIDATQAKQLREWLTLCDQAEIQHQT